MAIYNIDGIEISSSIFVNVKDFGAVGDGVTDDSTSINEAIYSVHESGGLIYFPKGTYLLKANVVFFSNQTLWFENGASLLQGDSIDNLLISRCASTTEEYDGTHDCLIYGGTFDGGNFTTNNTLVGIVHAKNITFENCTFKNAYGTYHNLEVNSSYNVKIINCDFEGSRKTGINAEMIQIDAINNVNTWPWSDNRGVVDSTVSKYIEIAGCIFHDDTVSPAIGNHSEASDSFIRIHDNVFDGLTSSRGAINMQSADNVDIYSNTFNGCTVGVGRSTSAYFVHNNRFVGVTTAVNGGAIAPSNMINGTYTA